MREIRVADQRKSEGFEKFFQEQVSIAREALDRANPEQALEILGKVRGSFPELAKTSKGVLYLLIDLGALDEAETMIREGRKRYPQSELFARGFMAVARRRGDLQEVLQRCDTVRAKFPRIAEGYSVAAACLVDLGCLSEAEALIARGAQMAPNEAELHIQNARNAARCRDWPEALRRWEVVRSRFPQQFLGPLGAAQCLKELRRFDEAEEILGDARERFYRVNWIFVEWADLATAKGALEEAAVRWRAVLKRYPTFSHACLKATEALCKVGQVDEADEVLALAVERMRFDLAVHLEYARSADRRGDRAAAALRWTLVRERFPDNAEARIYGAEALAELESRDRQ